MKTAQLFAPALLFVVAACGPQEGARCEETELMVPWSEPIGGGMSGQDWMDAYAGTFTGQLDWEMPGDLLEGELPEGSTTFTLTVERSGDTVIHLDAERIGGDQERLACFDTVRLPAMARLSTDDGSFDVQVEGRLYAWPGEAGRLFGALEFEPADNTGTVQFAPADPDSYDDPIVARLQFSLEDDGVSGSVYLEAAPPIAEDERSSQLPEYYAGIAVYDGPRVD